MIFAFSRKWCYLNMLTQNPYLKVWRQIQCPSYCSICYCRDRLNSVHNSRSSRWLHGYVEPEYPNHCWLTFESVVKVSIFFPTNPHFQRFLIPLQKRPQLFWQVSVKKGIIIKRKKKDWSTDSLNEYVLYHADIIEAMSQESSNSVEAIGRC